MRTLLFFLFMTLLGAISCSQKQEINAEIREEAAKLESNPYIDSMIFRHYKRRSKPYIFSSCTYAFSDSMSEVLDSMNMDTLIEMNLSDRLYEDPLSHKLSGDTIVVDLIYRPGYSRFPFGEIRSHGDSIFLKLSGDAFKKLPEVGKNYYVRRRYFRSEFKILIDSTKSYRVYFRNNDSFEKKR